MKLWKFSVLVLLGISSLISCQSLKNARSPAGAKPRHIIVTIHGISGTETAFGSLLPALQKHLTKVDGGYDVVTANFTYPTGSKNASLSNFKDQFAEFMRKLFSENPITTQDRISFVAHSQGGLIAVFWYVDALSHVLAENDFKIANQVRNIVTESTPFWGAKGAYFVYDRLKIPLLRALMLKFVRMSPSELEELSFASDSIYRFFLSNAELLTDDSTGKEPLRMLNLAGIFPAWDNPLIQGSLSTLAPNIAQKAYSKIQDDFLSFFNTGTRWESDSVVNVSSARMKFMYAVEAGPYKKNQLTSMSQFKTSSFMDLEVPFQLVETMHASPEANRIMDIAYVPERCTEEDQCDHPTYKTIFKHVADCERKNSTCDMTAYQNMLEILFHGDTSYGMNEHLQLMSQMQTYSLMINLRLPPDYTVTRQLLNNDDVEKYIQPGYQRHQGKIINVLGLEKDGLLNPIEEDQIYRAYLGRRAEPFSRVIKHFKEESQLRFQFTGKIQPIESSPKYSAENYQQMANDGFKIKIKISLPGLKDRLVEVPVKPTFTTFVDLEMDPESN